MNHVTTTILFFFVVYLTSGYKTLTSGDASLHNESAGNITETLNPREEIFNIRPLDCKENAPEPSHFLLTKLTSLPPVDIFKAFFENSEKELNVQTSDHNSDQNNRFRFDFCFNQETEEIKPQRIVFIPRKHPQLPSRPTRTLFSPGQKSIGLAPALFEEDYSNVKVFYKDNLDPNWQNRVLLGLERNGESFLALIPGTLKESGKIKTNEFTQTIYITVGKLKYGDIAVSGKCKLGEALEKWSFEIGTATFEAETCVWKLPGDSQGYRFLSILVADSHPSLTEEQRQQLKLTGERLKNVLKYKLFHHNSCDTFELDLGHVIYAATEPVLFTMDDACQGVGNAPARGIESNEVRWKRKYRVKYGSNPWISGFAPARQVSRISE